MTQIVDYNEIMSDRNKFNDFVYTPLSEALKILEERQKDPELVKKVEDLLNGDIPEFFKKNNKCGVHFRQIATPNNEAKKFLKIAKDFDMLPVFMEYHSDKFSSNNPFKRSLGQLNMEGPLNKINEYRFEKISIMDFNKHNGKSLKEVVTHWNEPLIDFHKGLFVVSGLDDKDCHFFDTSEWIKNHGGKPELYYKNFLLFFTCHGILFENFLNSKNGEGDFTKDVILPAIEEIMKLTGVKPLIVPTDPLDMESDNYWTLYHPDTKILINKKLNKEDKFEK